MTGLPRRWFPRLRFSLRTLVIAVLLVGSAGGLWWRWEPWAEKWQLPSFAVSAAFSPNAKFVAAVTGKVWVSQERAPELLLLDVYTGAVYRRFNEKLSSTDWVMPGIYFSAESSEVGFVSYINNGSALGVHSWYAQTGEKLSCVLSPESLPHLRKCGGPEAWTSGEEWSYCEKTPDGEHMLSLKGGRLRVLSARRPEYWWGLAWLPEFWLTHLLALGFIWSLWRDRRDLRKRSTTGPAAPA